MQMLPQNILINFVARIPRFQYLSGYRATFFFIFLFSALNILGNKQNSYVVTAISVFGNTVTKPDVVLSELTFAINDTLDFDLIANHIVLSKNNLQRTPLFNSVDIQYSITENKLIFVINVEERWYLWPQLVLNFADIDFNAWLDKKDWSRLIYGIRLYKYNFRGRNEILKLLFVSGFIQQRGITWYDIYLDKQRKHSLGGSFLYSFQNYVDYSIFENKVLTFKSDKRNIYEYYKSSFDYTLRLGLNQKVKATLGYEKYEISDTVFNLNPFFLGNNQRKASFGYINISYLLDTRNQRSYPLSGSWVRFTFSKKGFYTKYENVNCIGIELTAKSYYGLSSKVTSATSINFRLNEQKVKPLFMQVPSGNDNNFQGYEYYSLFGDISVLYKGLLKYELVAPRKTTLKFVPWQKFNKPSYAIYSNLFVNAGYYQNRMDIVESTKNNLLNSWQYSLGVGVDFVTYYDRVFRVELTMNKMRRMGVYFHFVSPI
jgi:hypothetical protein